MVSEGGMVVNGLNEAGLGLLENRVSSCAGERETQGGIKDSEFSPLQ